MTYSLKTMVITNLIGYGTTLIGVLLMETDCLFKQIEREKLMTIKQIIALGGGGNTRNLLALWKACVGISVRQQLSTL